MLKKFFQLLKKTKEEIKARATEEGRNEKFVEKKLKEMFTDYLVYLGYDKKEAKKKVDEWYKANKDIIMRSMDKLLDIL